MYIWFILCCYVFSSFLCLTCLSVCLWCGHVPEIKALIDWLLIIVLKSIYVSPRIVHFKSSLYTTFLYYFFTSNNTSRCPLWTRINIAWCYHSAVVATWLRHVTFTAELYDWLAGTFMRRQNANEWSSFLLSRSPRQRFIGADRSSLWPTHYASVYNPSDYSPTTIINLTK